MTGNTEKPKRPYRQSLIWGIISQHSVANGSNVVFIKAERGCLINADVNGSYNIMRKEVGDVALPADRGFVFNPIKINF